MATITALESFNYAGLDRSRGDSFEASAEDAKILVLIGKAVHDPTPVPTPWELPITSEPAALESSVDETHAWPTIPTRRRGRAAASASTPVE